MGKWRLFLIFIVILASILRFYKLGSTPAGLEWDEVALGYDAYSLIHTGKDQFGTFLPSTFRSLDDYKPPIYVYSAVPGILFFGLNDTTSRLPAAVFGILAIIATFFLVKNICQNVELLKKSRYKIALLAGLFLAISPWHLQFSRAAFEVNIAVCITVTAVLCFLEGLKRPRIFILSGALFGLDLFSYHSARVVGPLLMLVLFVFFNKALPKRKTILSFFIVFGVFFMAVLPILRSKDAQIRFRATNIFTPAARYLNEKDLEKIFLDMRIEDSKIGFEKAGKIFHNQRLKYLDYDTLKKAANNYISNYGFEYLFIIGDARLHHAPGFGLLYILELPFLLLGILYVLFRARNPYTLLIIAWLLIAPIPNAVTREAPHAVRTELILPMYQILTAMGVYVVFRIAKNQSWWVYVPTILCLTGMITLNFAFYLHQYYVHTNYELSEYWFDSRKEAVAYTEKNKGKYEKVIVSIKVDMPHMFWLYYTKYSPQKYLNNGGTVSGGFEEQKNKFDKYEFRGFNYNLENELPSKKLLVGLPIEFPPDAVPVEVIKHQNGKEALYFVEVGK